MYSRRIQELKTKIELWWISGWQKGEYSKQTKTTNKGTEVRMKLKHFGGKENGMGHRGYKLNHVEIEISQVGGKERQGDLEGQGMMLVLAVIGNQVGSEIVFEQHYASEPTQATAQVQKMQTHRRPKVCFSRKRSHIKPTLQRIGRFETLNRINTYCEGFIVIADCLLGQ